MSRKKTIVCFVVNTYLVVSTLVITISHLLASGQPDNPAVGLRGVRNLIYYTVESNILLALCAAGVMILVCFRKQQFPVWFHFLFLAAAVSVCVTFTTVALFLAPELAFNGHSYFSLFKDSNLFFHLINPLLGAADFILLIPHRRFSIAQCIWGMIPTIIYSIVYVITVVIVKSWPDIYNFTFGGHYELAPIPVVSLYALSFGLSVLLTRLHHKAGRIQPSGKQV